MTRSKTLAPFAALTAGLLVLAGCEGGPMMMNSGTPSDASVEGSATVDATPSGINEDANPDEGNTAGE